MSNKQFTVTLTKDGSTNVELSSGGTVVTIPVTVITPEPTGKPLIELDSNSIEALTPGSGSGAFVTKIVPALTGDQTLTVFDQTPHDGVKVAYDKSVGDYGMITIDVAESVVGDFSGTIGITHPLSPAGTLDQTLSYSVHTPVEHSIEVWPNTVGLVYPNSTPSTIKLTPGSTTTLAVTKLEPELTFRQKLGIKLQNTSFQDDDTNSKYITAEFAGYDPSVGQLGSVIVHASPDLPTDGSVDGIIKVSLPDGEQYNSTVWYKAVSEASLPKITDLQIASPITGTANTDIIIKPTSITPSDAKLSFDEVAFDYPQLSDTSAKFSTKFDENGNLTIKVDKPSTGTVNLIYSLGKDFKKINLELDIK